MQNNQNQDQQTQGFLHSNTAKIIMVGVLTLVLLIPLQLVKGLIWERAQRQEDVIFEINDKWGSDVYFNGPMLKVPYTVYEKTILTNEKTKQVTTRRTASTKYAYFLPENLTIDSDVQTQILHRNNYESAVYKSKTKLNGSYSKPSFADTDIDSEDIAWEKATIVIETSNLKSIDGNIAINYNGKSYPFEPVATGRNNVASLETKAINLIGLQTEKAPFSLNIGYKGSKQLKIAPIGKTTTATMSSNWHTPSFTGNFIPDNKTITDNGFNASWSISHFNRPFPQQFFGKQPNLEEYAFAVDFLIPVDEYQQNERAAKYGFLVIGLTFLVFFLIQMVSKINIHIFQYTMIGLALIMFYTLLISITEHSSFLLAYIIAGTGVVVMIGAYSMSILKSAKFSALIVASLTALYTFIYVIIQLENYALLVGSIGLFLILGTVMFISRKIDWNNNTRV